MCGNWKLLSYREVPGVLDRQKNFFGTHANQIQRLKAMQVSIPMEAKTKMLTGSVVAGLASDTHARSLELWWDGTIQHHLDVMLVSDEQDILEYRKNFEATNPGAIITPYLPGITNSSEEQTTTSSSATNNNSPPVPDWFLRQNTHRLQDGKNSNNYHIFDVGYRHGHFFAPLNQNTQHDIISHMANIMQISQHAWIQLVFQKYNFTQHLHHLLGTLRYKNTELTSDTYISTRDYILSSEMKQRPHPEKGHDYTTHYNMLASHIAQKAQDEHVMLSIRGIFDSPKDIQLDFTPLQSAQMPGGSSAGYDHLMMNHYHKSDKFLNAEITLRDSIHSREKIQQPKIKRKSTEIQYYYSGFPVEPRNIEDTVIFDDIAARIEASVEQENDEQHTNQHTPNDEHHNNHDEKNQRKNKEKFKEKHKKNPYLKKKYRRLDIFEYRLLPDPKSVSRTVSKYVSKKYWGLLGSQYNKRQSPPFLLLTLAELGIFLKLPDPSTPNLTFSRKPETPVQQIIKYGFRLGYIERQHSLMFSSKDESDDSQNNNITTITQQSSNSLLPSPYLSNETTPQDTLEDKSPPLSNAPNYLPTTIGVNTNNNNSEKNSNNTNTTPQNDHQQEHRIRNWYGRIVQASEHQSVVLSTKDIPTHIYMVGGTKSGKTTLIRCIAKHLEMANLHGTFPNAFIFIDPKGSDSYEFLRQCETTTYEQNRVMFLDPLDTKFSINVLELPSYGKVGDILDPTATPPKLLTLEILAERRQNLVSQYVGYIMQMIKYWYQGSDTFVRLNRILDTLLQYVYLKNDKPTFLDLYEIIIAMQKDGKDMLIKMFKELGRPADNALEQAIESVASMEKVAYEPVLNRLEKFATDPILKHMFCVRESTVKFEDMIAPGAFTVIRLSQLNIPQHIITLAKQTLVIKLWFAIQERAERIRIEAERTQVLLALDEFQDVAGLPIIEAMLTQARSYGLGLLLAHQTTTQLNEGLFDIITGNAGTQFVGRVSGNDAGKFGEIWEPKRARELKAQLATQEFHHWTARLIADDTSGKPEQQPIPIQFWPVFTSNKTQTEQFINNFIDSQRAKYGYGEVGPSSMKAAESASNLWLNNIPYEPPSRDEWHIMCILANSGTSLILKQITAIFQKGTTASDTVSGILKKMVEKKLLVKGGTQKNPNKYAFILPEATRQKYLDFNPQDIGTSVDIPLATQQAVQYYLQNYNFLCVANQTVKKGKLRTDLVAYNYDTSTPISVEIESAAEVSRHPEHVKLNMTKWHKLGFVRCHVWSTNAEIKNIYNTLTAEEKKGVRIFVINTNDSK